MALHNRINKQELKKKLMDEPFKRITVSFYRYVRFEDPAGFRNQMYTSFDSLNIFGRIYLANEGINAQISVPEMNWDKFKAFLQDDNRLKDMPLKIAVEDDGKSFYKLTIKVRNKIVADGLDDSSFDVTNVGRHLNA